MGREISRKGAKEDAKHAKKIKKFFLAFSASFLASLRESWGSR